LAEITSTVSVPEDPVMRVGVCQGMMGGYSNAVKRQLGEILVLTTIFPNFSS
jgi:hypothetical protein